MTPRQEAKANGYTTYQSDRGGCKICGGSERYTSNGACVFCTLQRSNAANPDYVYDPMRGNEKRISQELRRAAAEAGQATYEGGACKKCGGTTRYTSNGACVPCMRKTAKASQEFFKANREAVRPQPFVFQPCACDKHRGLFASLPYMEGKGAVYVNCDMTAALRDISAKTQKPKTNGKCVLCHPNELITFANQYNARALPGLDQTCTRLLFDLCGSDSPLASGGHSAATNALRDQRLQWFTARGREYTPPVRATKKEPEPLPLPGLVLPDMTGGHDDDY